jgi:hypothetical protein
VPLNCSGHNSENVHFNSPQGLSSHPGGGAQYPVTQTAVLASASCWLVRWVKTAHLKEDNSDKKPGPTGWGFCTRLVTQSYENRHTQIPQKKRCQNDNTLKTKAKKKKQDKWVDIGENWNIEMWNVRHISHKLAELQTEFMNKKIDIVILSETKKN